MEIPTATFDLAAFTRSRAVPTLGVFIAYEDVSAGMRAMEVLSVLAAQAGNHVQIEPCPWRMDLLADTKLQAMAQKEAAHSHLLILSMGDSSSLSRAVLDWTNAWLRRQGETHAAIVLLGTGQHPLPRYQLLQCSDKRREHYYRIVTQSSPMMSPSGRVKKAAVQEASRALLVTGTPEDPSLRWNTRHHNE